MEAARDETPVALGRLGSELLAALLGFNQDPPLPSTTTIASDIIFSLLHVTRVKILELEVEVDDVGCWSHCREWQPRTAVKTSQPDDTRAEAALG